MSNEITNYLKNYSKKSELFLKKFFSKEKINAKKIDATSLKNLEDFEEYSYGGKNLRGALTMLGYQMVGGNNLETILPISCAIQLFHNFLLVHDDIIDKDTVRRNKPTIHTIGSLQYGEHFGISRAISIGDLGALLAFKLMINSRIDSSLLLKALLSLDNFLINTIYGELMDIEFDVKEKIIWDDIYKIRLYKTAYYTIVMPLTVGAILGKTSQKSLLNIRKFGELLGIVFQLADDVLGIYGDFKKTGKSNDSDIKEGKKTLLYAKAFELSAEKDKQYLLKYYGLPGVNSQQIEKVRNIIKSSGSLGYSLNTIKRLASKSKKVIPRLTTINNYQQLLNQLVDFVVQRSN